MALKTVAGPISSTWIMGPRFRGDDTECVETHQRLPNNREISQIGITITAPSRK
jgi:hypothetical protein